MGLTVIIGTQQGDGAGGLGEPVGVHEADIGQQGHRPLDHREGHRTPTVGERSQRREAAAVFGHHVEDPVEHGGDHHRMGH